MSCVTPIEAFRGAGRAIVFDRRFSLSKVPFNLPCGRCIGCRMEKARQWGMRCVHEAKMWKDNCFVTLTYDDEHLPVAGSVCYRDVQLFMKRLRKAKRSSVSNPLRFFLGAEYGETNRRPHYHALFFNCGFSDKLFLFNNARKEPLYTSAELTRLWGLGHCSIGEVTLDSAVYCAKYAMKKINISEKSGAEVRAEYERRYVVFDSDGVVYERAKEFAIMSRRPGIGATYYDTYGSEIRNLDSVVINGREVKPTRYYDLRGLQALGDAHDDNSILCKCLACANGRARRRGAVLGAADNTPERLLVKGKILQIAADKKERKL